jgi:dipeptidase E
MQPEQRQGHIVAMGGGGFSMDLDNTLLDDFILSLSPRHPAKVCFVPTASADSVAYLLNFYRAFSGRAITTDLTLNDPPSAPRRPSKTSEIAAHLAAQDVIYVGGGNTANLLALWRVHGVDQALRECWMRGAVLCGVSAGMLCWFRGGVTDSFGGYEALNDGLGFIDATACPHYDGEAERRPIYHRLVREGLPWGYAADDGAALHFHGTEFVGAVSSRPKAAAYRVERVDGQVRETRLETRYLGAR